MIQFQEFPKIPRYKREVCVTEKIDGTNAAVVWAPTGAEGLHENALWEVNLIDQHGVYQGPHQLLVQSRSRFIVPGADNYGFAKWVVEHKEELTKLGPGVHYGEWWGHGIQRGYGLTEKRFSLFNVQRWGDEKWSRPACCHVVPLLGYCQPSEIQFYLCELANAGSRAATGFNKPEGVVVWHSQSKQYYKILLEHDEIPKNVYQGGA
jgi:hypothetical protein